MCRTSRTDALRVCWSCGDSGPDVRIYPDFWGDGSEDIPLCGICWDVYEAEEEERVRQWATELPPDPPPTGMDAFDMWWDRRKEDADDRYLL